MAVVFGDVARDTERYRLTLTDEVLVVDSMREMTDYLDEHDGEDLVIVGPDAPMNVATDLAEKYRADRPSLSVILLCRRIDMTTMADALRSGIREVVSADDAQALLSACTRAKTVSRQLRHIELKAGDGRKGRIVLVFSAKGGCGKTTLATNLAQALAGMEAGRVCLVDFNLEFGDVAIALQVEPVRTLSDALGMQGGLDEQGVRSMVITTKGGFDVLLAPTHPADAEFITAELVGEILRLLAETYDYVIIDSAPAFNDVSLKCFDISDAYVLLTTLDMLSLKNFKVTLDTLDALGYPRSRWNVVLNRCDSRVGLTPEEVQEVIGLPIIARLPSSKDVPASLNRGVTLVSDNPRHPFSRAVNDLAHLMSQGRAPARPMAKPKRHPSLFGRGGV